jgi:site-specific recombinase XerD
VLGEVAQPLSEVQPRDLRDVFRRQQQAGRSPSSINRAIGATRSFFRFLFEEGRLEMNPAQALRSIRLGPALAPKHLSVAEVQRLLSLPDIQTPVGRRDRAILMLLYNTGLRVGELCALSRDDVRLPAEGWGALQVVGKGKRLHRLPINRPAADALLAYLANRDDAEPALFLNRNGGRFSVRGIALLVNRYLRAAGITDRSGPHVLRHTFATHALRARPNLRAVQELLGHAWVTTPSATRTWRLKTCKSRWRTCRPTADATPPGQRRVPPASHACTWGLTLAANGWPDSTGYQPDVLSNRGFRVPPVPCYTLCSPRVHTSGGPFHG